MHIEGQSGGCLGEETVVGTERLKTKEVFIRNGGGNGILI